jgi:hypothetical protein
MTAVRKRSLPLKKYVLIYVLKIINIKHQKYYFKKFIFYGSWAKMIIYCVLPPYYIPIKMSHAKNHC